MGQKVHPGGLRVGVRHKGAMPVAGEWKSHWYTGKKEFASFLIEDVRIREHIYRKLGHAGLSDILIRKDKQRITIDIYTARPGIVIGKSGAEVDALRKEIHALTQKSVHININEIKRPELDAKLVSQSVAEQLENRVSFRRAMKRSLASAIRSGAQGVKISCGGRLGGGEMSRKETYSEGRVPLHTLRADIDYGFAEAKTTFGRIGVKVWINKGEVMPEGYGEGDERFAQRRAGRELEGLGASREAGRRGGPDREGLGPVRKRGGRRGTGAGRTGGGGGGARAPRGRDQETKAPADADQPQPDAEAPEQTTPVEAPEQATPVEAPETPETPEAATDSTPAARGRQLVLLPRRTKYRKQQRGRRRGLSKGQQVVNFGDYGLKALEAGWVTNRQIEAARIAMTRKIRRGGKVWINVFPDKPVSQKPAETRMGSGKGAPEHWVAVVKPGRVMFELSGVPEPLARDAMRLASMKLPIKTKFVRREVEL